MSDIGLLAQSSYMQVCGRLAALDSRILSSNWCLSLGVKWGSSNTIAFLLAPICGHKACIIAYIMPSYSSGSLREGGK